MDRDFRVLPLTEAAPRGSAYARARDAIRDVVLSRGAADDGLTMTG